MKLTVKIGDVVEVTKGKFAGQKAKIQKIDKRTMRVVLEGLKKHKITTKKQESKELHGSFHLSNLKSLAVTQPKEVSAAKAPEATPAAG